MNVLYYVFTLVLVTLSAVVIKTKEKGAKFVRTV